MCRVWQGIFNIIHRGFRFHPTGMCSALRGSEGPFCVKSPWKENIKIKGKKSLFQPPFSFLILTSIFHDVGTIVTISDPSVLRGTWKHLNAVKVIAQMTQDRMTSFSGISLSLSWCLDPEPVSDLRFHPLQKQQCSCTCSCRFEFSPTSGKMYSPLFLIKIVLAITLSSYPTCCLHTCFSPPLWVLR